MARVSTYLNFNRTTEEAFNFYQSVFGTEFTHPISRMGDSPTPEGYPPLAAEDKNLVMHVTLPILGGHILMGADISESFGMKIIQGNNMYINLEPDTREETDNLFKKLSDGGKVEVEPQEMFWGDYFASCTDKYGVQWLFNCSNKK